MLIRKNLNKKFKQKKNQTAKNNNIHYGFYALQAIENNNINIKQIESFKKIIKDQLKKKIKFLYKKLNINYPVTKKKKNSRMGKGKGDIQHYISKIKKGQILYELNNISYKTAKLVFFKASKKLPIKTRILIKK